MANEQNTGAPLTAAVGEQLAEKAHLEELREEEKRAGDVAGQRVERRKADERSDALRHAGAAPPAGRQSEGGWRAWRTWPSWRRAAAGVAALAALALVRRALR